jgi:hypothetical protein
LTDIADLTNDRFAHCSCKLKLFTYERWIVEAAHGPEKHFVLDGEAVKRISRKQMDVIRSSTIG